MYNEQIKKEYLEILEGSYRITTAWNFEKAESYEKKFNKDIYDFNEDEVIGFLRDVHAGSRSSLMSVSSVTRAYVDWAIANNLNKDHINHWKFAIKKVLEKECLNLQGVKKKIFSEEEVIYFAHQSVYPGDDYLIYAAYEGIGSDGAAEILQLTKNQIDEVNKTINLKRGVIPVSQRLIDSAKESIDTYEYMSANIRKIRFDESCPYAIKDRKGEFVKSNSEVALEKKLVRRFYRFKEIDERINFTTIRRSGIVNSISKVLLENNISFSDAVFTDLLETVKEKYGLTNRKNFTFKADFELYFD